MEFIIANNIMFSRMHEKQDNYIPDEHDIQIWENDTFQEFEYLPEGYSYHVEDLRFELKYELEKQLNKLLYFPTNVDHPDYHKFNLLQFWLFILCRVSEDLNSKELFAINYCISTYASVCDPWERRKEIRRNIFGLKDWFEENNLNADELERKIFEIDQLIFYELTEILLQSKVIHYCRWYLEDPPYYWILENDFKIPRSPGQMGEKNSIH
jgi:hypothetical protein